MKDLLLIFCCFIVSTISESPIHGEFVDPRDDHSYRTIKIGEQTWFAENLAFKTKKGSWVYNKDEKNLLDYGRLYNWKTACVACPNGWRLPTLEEFETMLQYVNDQDSTGYYDAFMVGGSSGFDVKFAGWYAGMKYGQLEEHTDFWTISEFQAFKGATKATHRVSFCRKTEEIYTNPDFRTYGFSVRCIKNEN